MPIIVENLKALVQKSGISQVELAGKLDLDRSYLSKLLNNPEGINTKYVERILSAINCTLSDLAGVPNSDQETRLSLLEKRISDIEASLK